MAEISVTALAMVDAPAEQVRTALADYREVRPAILTANFSGYQVIEGGQGAGSQVRWTYNPARWGRRRARDWEIKAEEVDGALVERDSHSGAVITWTVIEADAARSAVRVELVIPAPDGLRGMLARSRMGRLRRVYGEVLRGLRERIAADPRGTCAD